MSTRNDIHADITQRTAWAIPVKVEELKAALRAYGAAEDRLSALVSAVRQLPNIVLDIILEHVFEFWHKKRQKQWKIMYMCSSTSQDARVFGTVTLRAHKIGDIRIVDDLHNSYKEAFAWSNCRGCMALGRYDFDEWRNRECPGLEYWEAQERWCRINHQCEPCQALARGDEALHALTGHLEESVVDLDNVYDAHPQADFMFEYITYGKFWASAPQGQKGWLKARHSLATDWHTMMKNGLLLTEREINTLKDFGVDCILRQNSSSKLYKHTTALLVPHGAIKKVESYSAHEQPTKTISTTSLLELPPLLPQHENAFTKTLKRLRLTPCSKVDRQEAEVDNSRAKWPQLVSLLDTEFDPPIGSHERPDSQQYQRHYR